MTIVVDSSALLVAVLGSSSDAGALRLRLGADLCHAPHLIDAEVGNVLRREVLRGALSAADGEVLLTSARPLIDYRHETTTALARGAWLLRNNLSFYDALYAALARALDCPLLTADARLSRSTGLPCVVELIGQD